MRSSDLDSWQLRCHAAGVTDFQRRVYGATCAIPSGRVITYGQLASSIGCGSAQAVGQALRRNPFAPQVPCHGVIAADRTGGGFVGRRAGAALLRKRELLEAEGVEILDGVVAAACLNLEEPRMNTNRR
jgi:methylated-DNA-[protein]-cysteine S-methyltransferase